MAKRTKKTLEKVTTFAATYLQDNTACSVEDFKTAIETEFCSAHNSIESVTFRGDLIDMFDDLITEIEPAVTLKGVRYYDVFDLWTTWRAAPAKLAEKSQGDVATGTPAEPSAEMTPTPGTVPEGLAA